MDNIGPGVAWYLRLCESSYVFANVIHSEIPLFLTCQISCFAIMATNLPTYNLHIVIA